MSNEIICRHPFTHKEYHLWTQVDNKCRRKITLNWCEQLQAFGVKAWFSDRIWIINNKVEILL